MGSGSVDFAVMASTLERFRLRFPSDDGWAPGRIAPCQSNLLLLSLFRQGGEIGASLGGLGVP